MALANVRAVIGVVAVIFVSWITDASAGHADVNLPAWVAREMQRMKGPWVADNRAYTGAGEPYDAYGAVPGLVQPSSELNDRSLGRFDTRRDLFLPQFDCKTDVDDLHSVAAVATMLRDERFADVDYHAVAGAYGTQGGLYVPGEELFALAFGENWSDAHNDYDAALAAVSGQVIEVLQSGGSVWVAEGGQSDFTAAWLAKAKEALPDIDLRDRVHVVQHADWNEEVTTPEKLAYVKRTASYHKIPDGNATGNGTPGFLHDSPEHWPRASATPGTGELWELARKLGEAFNAADGRYNNQAVAKGGIDFSDTAETCWIFGFDDLFDAREFFDTFSEDVEPKIETGFARVNGTRLYYELAGTGDPIVLIHGNFGDRRYYDGQFEALARRHRVLRCDIRGYGESMRPEVSSLLQRPGSSSGSPLPL